jgi:hypothetical protein
VGERKHLHIVVGSDVKLLSENHSKEKECVDFKSITM